MLRFKLGQLGLAMAAVAVALAALIRATPPWVSVIYTVSLAAFTAAALAGLFASRRRRPFSAGAAITALIYVVAARSFAPPLEPAPAWGIRTWAEGGMTPSGGFFGTYPSTSYTITTQSPTFLTAPVSSAAAQAVVDSVLSDPAATAASPSLPATAPVPAAVPLIPSHPGPATLQQAASPPVNTWDFVSFSTIPPTGTAGWSRSNAGLIAEMEAVWVVAMAGGWLARRFAAGAEAEGSDDRTA